MDNCFVTFTILMLGGEIMKKIIIPMLCLLTFCLTGCGEKTTTYKCSYETSTDGGYQNYKENGTLEATLKGDKVISVILKDSVTYEEGWSKEDVEEEYEFQKTNLESMTGSMTVEGFTGSIDLDGMTINTVSEYDIDKLGSSTVQLLFDTDNLTKETLKKYYEEQGEYYDRDVTCE